MMTTYHSKEGGGLLRYLSLSANKTRNIDASFFTYSREAIARIMVINNITEDDKILMPSYQCNIVIDYIIPYTKNIEFYSIDENLTFDKNEILNKLDKKTKLVFFVSYFGLISTIDTNLLSIIKKNNSKIVYDLAHSFLSLYERNFLLTNDIDYVISSIYKNIPVGVGAIAIGDFNKADTLDNKEFVIVNLKRMATHFRCLVGKRAFTYYSLSDHSCSREEMTKYKENIIIASLYKKLLSHINIDKIIKDKKFIVYQYFLLFEHNKNFRNIVDKKHLKNNTLQAYPIKCGSKELREKLFYFLKSECIDVYPWPSYHVMNSFDTLRDKILLLPLDLFSLRRTEKFMKENN